MAKRGRYSEYTKEYIDSGSPKSPLDYFDVAGPSEFQENENKKKKGLGLTSDDFLTMLLVMQDFYNNKMRIGPDGKAAGPGIIPKTTRDQLIGGVTAKTGKKKKSLLDELES